MLGDVQVQQEAAPYWWLRAGVAPIALLNMALSGILQACPTVRRCSKT